MKKLVLLLSIAAFGCSRTLVGSDDLAEVKRLIRANGQAAANVDSRLIHLESSEHASVEHSQKLSADLERIVEALALLSSHLALMNCTPEAHAPRSP